MQRNLDPRVQRAVQLMAARVREPLAVADLAAAVGLSPSRFAHLFRAVMGISPLQYLHISRMTQARHLLDSTGLSVKQVMAAVGISDPSHFSRAFRRFHGVAPSEIRKTRFSCVHADAEHGAAESADE